MLTAAVALLFLSNKDTCSLHCSSTSSLVMLVNSVPVMVREGGAGCGGDGGFTASLRGFSPSEVLK